MMSSIDQKMAPCMLLAGRAIDRSDHVADELHVAVPVPLHEHLGRPRHRLPPRLSKHKHAANPVF